MSADERKEVFSVLGVAAFALAAWQDGSVWVSGFCAGMAFVGILHLLPVLFRASSESANVDSKR